MSTSYTNCTSCGDMVPDDCTDKDGTCDWCVARCRRVGDPDTVTITISREDAESWLSKQDDACTWDKCTAPACVLERAFRAALEGER